MTELLALKGMADEGLPLDAPFEYHAPRYYDFDQPSQDKDADPDAWFDTAETAGETFESSCVMNSNGMVSKPLTLCAMSTQAFVHPPATRKQAKGSSLMQAARLQRGRRLR